MSNQIIIFIGSGIVNAITALSLALFVLWKKRHELKERVNLLFVLLNLSIFFWAGSYVLWLLSLSASDALVWVRLLSVGSVFIALFHAHWVASLTKVKKLPSIIKFGYAYGALIIAIIFSPWFISGMEQKFFFPYWPNASWGFFFYILIYIFYPAYSAGLLYKSYKTLQKEEKERIKYVLYGTIIGFGSGVLNFPLWIGIPIIPYSNWLVAPYAIVLGYAMLKYKLLEVKTAIVEVMGIALILLSFYNLFFYNSFFDFILRVIMFILISIEVFVLLNSIKKEKIRIEEIGALNLQLQNSIQKEKMHTEQIETLNSQLNKSINELKKIDELKTEFVSLASHQLRTPLTPIKGFSDMLLEGSVGKGIIADEDQRNAIKMINESANRMDNLIDDILNVSKLEKEGGFTYKFEILNPEEIIKKVINDFTKQAKDKGLELSFASSLSPDTEVKLDPVKFTDAIGNLLSNSVKYTLKGTIWVNISQEEDNVVISVKDTGVGIEPEDMPRLFQKFYRGKEMARLDAMGTGLGLYFTRHVIEDHGGHITVQSEGPGKGSEFIVRLPKITNDQQRTTNDAGTDDSLAVQNKKEQEEKHDQVIVSQ